MICYERMIQTDTAKESRTQISGLRAWSPVLLYGHRGRCLQLQQKSEVAFRYIIKLDASLCCVRPCLKEKKIAAGKMLKVSTMKTLERIRIIIREKGKLASTHALRFAPSLTFLPPSQFSFSPSSLSSVLPQTHSPPPFDFPPCYQSKALLVSSCRRQSAKALKNQSQGKSFSYMIPVRVELS